MPDPRTLKIERLVFDFQGGITGHDRTASNVLAHEHRGGNVQDGGQHRVTHVPYKTAAQANGDVVAGQIPLAMAALPAVIAQVQGGMLGALAVTRQWPTVSGVPTIAESGYPGFSHMTWIGVLVPAGTPASIIARLNREIAAVLAIPDVRERIAALGAEPVHNSAADFEAMITALPSHERLP